MMATRGTTNADDDQDHQKPTATRIFHLRILVGKLS
jgi:hypothetical protein